MVSPIQQVIGTAASSTVTPRQNVVTPAENVASQPTNSQAAQLVSQVVAQQATTKVGNGDKNGVQIPPRSERSFADRDEQQQDQDHERDIKRAKDEIRGHGSLNLKV